MMFMVSPDRRRSWTIGLRILGLRCSRSRMPMAGVSSITTTACSAGPCRGVRSPLKALAICRGRSARSSGPRPSSLARRMIATSASPWAHCRAFRSQATVKIVSRRP